MTRTSSSQAKRGCRITAGDRCPTTESASRVRGLPMEHLENLFGQGIGVHEILIGPLQALGVTRSVTGLPFCR